MSFNQYLDLTRERLNPDALNYDRKTLFETIYNDSRDPGLNHMANDIRAFYADFAFWPDDANNDWVYDLIKQHRTKKPLPEVAIFQKVSFEEFKKSLQADVYDQSIHLQYPTIDDESFQMLYDELPLPICKTGNSACHDFAIPFGLELDPGMSIIIPTGIRCLIKRGHDLKIYPRSGLGTKYRCQIDNTVGIIDMDYYFSDNEGHIKLKITNDSKNGKTMTLKRGDAFCQGEIAEYKVAKNAVSNNVRNGGWGSTTTTTK